MSKTAAWGDANKNWKLFTTRFFDCQLCSGHGVDEATLAKCDAAHKAHYEFAYCRFARNAAAAADFLNLPSNRIVELGAKVEI